MSKPTTTAAVTPDSNHSQGTEEISRALISLSKAEMSLSRAEVELSKAETSVGKVEAVWMRWAKITIVLLFAPIRYGVSLIILALREYYVYKKFIKSQNNALQVPLYRLLLGKVERQ
jgi:hypothetical protein